MSAYVDVTQCHVTPILTVTPVPARQHQSVAVCSVKPMDLSLFVLRLDAL